MDKVKGKTAKRVEKKREKEKKQEIGKLHRERTENQLEHSKLEGELKQLVIKLSSDGGKKLISNIQIGRKIGQINDVRVKLELPAKNFDDFKDLIKEAKKEAKMLLKSKDKPKPIPLVEPTEIVRKTINMAEPLQDLSHIPIPSGLAPETEGQIYNALENLPEISHLADAIGSVIEDSSQYMPVMPPEFSAFIPPPAFMMQYPGIPLPLASLPTPGFRPPSEPVVVNSGRLAPKNFPKTSQAPKTAAIDPLAPEIDMDMNQGQEAKTKTVFASAPVKRDFQKEVVKSGFKPSILQK